MRILDRYIGQTVLISILSVLVVILSLFLLINFVNEFDKIGRADYTIWKAMMYVLLKMPQNIYEIFPMAALLGTMLGLGALSKKSELVVIRTSGVSRMRISLAVIKSAVLLIVLVVIVGEIIAPSATQYAKQTRLKALAAQLSLNTDYGLWARDGNTFIHVRSVIHDERLDVEHDERLVDINLYTLSDTGKLSKQLHADTAHYNGEAWILEKVTESYIDHTGIDQVVTSQQEWKTLLDPELVNIVSLEPTNLAVWKLLDYIHYLRSNGLESKQYELAMWNKLIAPFTILAMVLVAVPFMFGSQRQTSIGLQVVLGFIVGVTFYIANRLAGEIGLVYDFRPVISASLPTLLVFALAAWQFHRTR
ncbi:MAG: LPS export ABC transporter permease LptG [Gammaproteobacteria bacterium]